MLPLLAAANAPPLALAAGIAPPNRRPQPPACFACLQGVPLELRGMLPSLTELDLSDNLISSWSFVAELATALPSLRALNLSGNRLALPSLADAAPLPSLAGLQTLVLNGCGVSWEQAVAVARQLPGLRELHLCGNRLASLQLPAAAVAAAGAGLEGLSLSPDDPAKSSSSVGGSDGVGSSCGSNGDGSTAALLAAAFPQLELLDLEDNALASWHADAALLSQLPCLRSLLLCGNQLADVQYGGGERAGTGMHCKRAAMSWHACPGCCCRLWQLKLVSCVPVLSARRLYVAAGAAAGRQPAGQLAIRQPAGRLPCAGGGAPV